MTERNQTANVPRADPTIGKLAAVEEGHQRPPASVTQKRHGPALVALAGLGVAVTSALLWYAWQQQPQRAATDQPATVSANPPQAAPAAAAPSAEPAIRHPIEDAPVLADADETPLPPLAQSDPMMRDALASVFGSAALDRVFRTDDIVHRFVATIDNLARTPVSLHFSPVNPVPGSFRTSGRGERRVIAADNAARYTPYVRMVEMIDAKRLASLYVHSYPLFQSAYKDLGYPKGYFNDRLIQVVDDLLAAPELRGPVPVVQPKVLYQYADPDLESRSAGQKMMMRMGSDNAVRVKAKLRELRRELTRMH